MKTTTEQASVQEKRNTLLHRILSWQKAQDIYMPFVSALRGQSDTEDTDADSPILAETISLFLPSACPPSLRVGILTLADKERRLRLAQAYDALAHIRRLRRILTHIIEFKHTQTSGTGNRSNTRIRSLFDKFQTRIKRAAARYRAAYGTLNILDADRSWAGTLKELKDEDIRGPKRADDEDFTEGTYEPSWIWLARDGADNSQDFIDAMRVEWGKTKARLQRWSEELQLLQEEMRRVLEYCSWKARWWRSRYVERPGVDAGVKSGLMAYAEKQTVVFERLGWKFGQEWTKVLSKHQLNAEWNPVYGKLPSVPSLIEVEEEESTSGREGSYRMEE